MSPGRIHTKVDAGRCVAVFVDDGQGRRIVLAAGGNFLLTDPLVVALSQGQVDQVIAALKSLREELPPGFIEEKT